MAVARTFKLQAEDLRMTRGFTAKEKAAKANPQVTLVTTFFIAPAVFGFIMGLIVLNIIHNPAAFGLDAFALNYKTSGGKENDEKIWWNHE